MRNLQIIVVFLFQIVLSYSQVIDSMIVGDILMYHESPIIVTQDNQAPPPSEKTLNQLWEYDLPVGEGFQGHITLYDFENDGFYEIIATTTEGGLYAWNAFGELLDGFPYYFPEANGCDYGVAIADLENDGIIEICYAVNLEMSQRGYNRIALVVLEYVINPGKNNSLNLRWSNIVTATFHNYSFFQTTSPILYDMNYDGNLEIIVAYCEVMTQATRGVRVFDKDGTQIIREPLSVTHFAVGDIDNDTEPEIVGHLATLNYSGEIEGQIMVNTFSWLSHSRALINLDNDSEIEHWFPFNLFYTESYPPNVHIFDSISGVFPDLPYLTGFPSSINYSQCSSPSIGYILSSDDKPSLVALTNSALFGCGDLYMYVKNYDGTDNVYFDPPKDFPTNDSCRSTTPSPLIADINDDGASEFIIFCSILSDQDEPDYGNIFIVSNESNILSEHTTQYSICSTPAIRDIDNNGTFDLVVGTGFYNLYRGRLEVFDLGGSYNDTKVEWGKFQVNPRNTGMFGGGRLGDVNIDGMINVCDVVKVVNYILGNTNFEPYVFTRADLAAPYPEGDGYINILDVIALQNIILNQDSELKKTTHNGKVEVNFNLSNTSKYLTKQANTVYELVVNAAEPIAGFQTSINIDPSVYDSVLVERSNSLIDCNQSLYYSYYDSVLKIIVFSEEGYTYQDSGAVLYITLLQNNITKHANNQDIKVKNIILSDICGRAIDFKKIKTPDAEAYIPNDFSICCYPNPFNSNITIKYILDNEGWIEVSIFDINGCQVSKLTNGIYNPGDYYLMWNGKNDNGFDVGSGLYFIGINSKKKMEFKKILLIK